MKSRAKHRCPEKLARLLEHVNALPPDCEERFTRALALLRQLRQAESESDEWQEMSLRRELSQVIDLGIGVFLPLNDLLNRVFAYGEIVWIKEELTICAQLQITARVLRTDLQDAYDKTDFITGNIIRRGKFRSSGVCPTLTNGLLKYKANPWVELCNIESIDPLRIRTCAVCQIFFWAERKDMNCCSPVHANRLRVRTAYRGKKEQYEANRAAKERKGKRDQ